MALLLNYLAFSLLFAANLHSSLPAASCTAAHSSILSLQIGIQISFSLLNHRNLKHVNCCFILSFFHKYSFLLFLTTQHPHLTFQQKPSSAVTVSDEKLIADSPSFCCRVCSVYCCSGDLFQLTHFHKSWIVYCLPEVDVSSHAGMPA